MMLVGSCGWAALRKLGLLTEKRFLSLKYTMGWRRGEADPKTFYECRCQQWKAPLSLQCHCSRMCWVNVLWPYILSGLDQLINWVIIERQTRTVSVKVPAKSRWFMWRFKWFKWRDFTDQDTSRAAPRWVQCKEKRSAVWPRCRNGPGMVNEVPLD